MKTILAILPLLAVNSSFALACSPPPSLLYVQPSEMARVISSDEVFSTLQKLAARSILNVNVGRVGYEILADNGCIVVATVEYTLPGNGGLCPSVNGVKIISATCPASNSTINYTPQRN